MTTIKKYCIIKVKEDNKNSNMTKEQQKLIEDNYPFYIYWFSVHNISDEDTKQDLILTLCKYIHLYDANKSKFTTFVHNIFYTRCIRLSKQSYNSVRILNEISVSMDSPIGTDGTDTYSDIIPDTEDKYSSTEFKIIADDILKGLPKLVNKHHLDIFLTWLDTGSYVKTAKIFGVSRQAIQQIIGKVRKKIKEKWETPFET